MSAVTALLSASFSILYWIFLATTAFVLYLAALLLCLGTALFDPKRSLLHRYTCWWAQLYLRCLPGCRIRVYGREKIVPGTPLVLVANHQSIADIMALSALAVPFKWVSKKEAFRLPFIGWNMVLNQYVCVDRGNVRSLRATMERCRFWLARAMPVLMFPEGHRSPDGAIHEFHGGAFRLAVDGGCAVVPIVVDGTRSIYHGWKVRAWPGTITIRILDPIPSSAGKEQVELLRRRAFEQMQQALAEIRGPVPFPPVPTARPQPADVP